MHWSNSWFVHVHLLRLRLSAVQGICDGMLQVLAKDAGALADMGARARALFEADREAFSEAMGEVLGLLHSLLEVAEAAAMMD